MGEDEREYRVCLIWQRHRRREVGVIDHDREFLGVNSDWSSCEGSIEFGL